MKIISIHDYENSRAIIAHVPSYLTAKTNDDEVLAQAIFDALGISSGNAEWMMLEDSGRSVCVDLDIFNASAHSNGYVRLDELTQDFKEDALASLEKSAA